MPTARITFNTNGWKHPSGPMGKCPGLWESIAGFGFEEWYRNELFQKKEDGEIWQYGYLQCFKNSEGHKGVTYYDVDLFTRQCIGYLSRWILVVKYSSIYVLNDVERLAAEQHFANELLAIRQSLNNIGINVVGYFDNQPDNIPKINFKFKIKDENFIFDLENPINYRPVNRGWRYRNFYY